jgi:hypothetical protein
MASRLTVIFYIILCLILGTCLTVLPWWQPWGTSDWGDNYFLVAAAHKTGFISLQHAVASSWVRGAVTGLGILNLMAAFWETFNFRDTVRRLENFDREPTPTASAAPAPTTDTHATSETTASDARAVSDTHNAA